jgi:hypothetical protein
MKLHTKDLGDLAELILTTELVSRGLTVAVPYGENQLFDLIVEHGVSKKLLKVQVKMRSSLDTKTTAKFKCLAKYVGKVDIVAFLVDGDWYFWGKVKLKRYGTFQTVTLKVNHNTKNNWKMFGV